MPRRFVHLEDDRNDRDLVADVLRADGILCTIAAVDSRDAFERALADPPDLILADMSLPGFDGVTAQAMAAEICPGVPFIYVSGSMGEENAVERLRTGATDYVLKHRLEKLPTAVRRALAERDNRIQRARAEEALQQLNTELAARVEQRTRDLKEANEQLIAARQEAERANQAKSEFLSRMSHDLRTPLNAVMGFAQVLELEPLTAPQRDAVTHILRGGRHLLGLINEVLDIAKIEAGRLSLSSEPTPLDEVISQAVELIRPLATQRALSIEVRPIGRTYVMADRQRLNEILFNLLSNAVKYNRYGGAIRIGVDVGPQRSSIAVSDTGAGIPAEKMKLLFTPFERLGADQTEVEGTGLGLALAKGLAEAMNGKISVESEVDHGTTFRLELPTTQAAVAKEEMEQPAVPRDAGTSGVVLYIEDNIPNMQLMKQVLMRRPAVELLHAPNGNEGLRILRERKPDLVFLDLHLPDIPGEEVLRQIWEDPATRAIPVAVLTADATPGQKRRLLVSGAAAYLTKPFDIREVLRMVDRSLSKTDAAES